jgi:hypothetical protein
VTLARDLTDSASFVLPHADSIARRACSYESIDEQVTVVGFVRAGGSGRPAGGRTVRAQWQALRQSEDRIVSEPVEKTARTDDTGYYLLCGLPPGVPVTISTDGARSANIIYPRRVGGYLLYARAREPTEPYTRSFETSHRTWKVDLLLTGRSVSRSSRAQIKALSGYVTDRVTDRPLDGVKIILNDSDSTETRSDGTFDLVDARLVRGNNSVTAYHNGFQLWSDEIWHDSAVAHIQLSIELEPQPN